MAVNCYLDSNICIAYLQKTHISHQSATKIIKAIRVKGFVVSISPLCLDETIHILLRDGQKTRTPNYFLIVKKQISRFLKIPNLEIINPPPTPRSQIQIFGFINKYHLKTRDAFHLLIAKHHRIKYFATFDHDFDLVFSSHALKQFLNWL